MLEEPFTVEGTVAVSEIEGRHYELLVDAGRDERYVLVPAG